MSGGSISGFSNTSCSSSASAPTSQGPSKKTWSGQVRVAVKESHLVCMDVRWVTLEKSVHFSKCIPVHIALHLCVFVCEIEMFLHALL